MAYLVTSTGTSRLWYHADERGSVVGISSDAGASYAAVGFDEYGVGTGTSRFHYTGQYWLGGDLHYYRARMYDARLGRFLQPDPIGYGAGMNMYAYVMGDPVNLVDPSGLKWVEACVGDGAIMDCGWHWVGGGGGAGGMGGGGGRFEPNMVGDGGGGGVGGPLELVPIICPPAPAKVTGVGPTQANGKDKTSISQTPGKDIVSGSVAIDPTDFGVSDARGPRRSIFDGIILIPLWHLVSPPNSYSPAIPKGLPSSGPYDVVDVIGPASARNKPGFHIDLYRYSSQNDAFASTRTVPVIAIIPGNELGVSCPTGN